VSKEENNKKERNLIATKCAINIYCEKILFCVLDLCVGKSRPAVEQPVCDTHVCVDEI
jgi:hypothetical protein